MTLLRVSSLALFVFPSFAYAGFDVGPVGNGLFWVALVLWSALIAWVFYVRRNSLGKSIFSFMRAIALPHGKKTIVVSAPKYRPYVQTTRMVDTLEHAADSFLRAAKTGAHTMQTSGREALTILEDDARTALSAAKKQAQTIRHHTSVGDRVRNVQRLLKGEKKAVSPVVHGTHLDSAAHTRQKVQVLADAHRALIRAKNAQDDLPVAAVTREEVHAPISVVDDVPEYVPVVEESRKTIEPVFVQPQVVEIQHTTVSKVKAHPIPAPVVSVQKHVEKQAQKSVAAHEISGVKTQDELVLDTSGPVPRLVLTRKNV